MVLLPLNKELLSILMENEADCFKKEVSVLRVDLQRDSLHSFIILNCSHISEHNQYERKPSTSISNAETYVMSIFCEFLLYF